MLDVEIRKDKFAPFNCGEYFWGNFVCENCSLAVYLYNHLPSKARFCHCFPRCKIKFYRWPVMVIVILDRFNLVRNSLKRDLVLIVHCNYRII